MSETSRRRTVIGILIAVAVLLVAAGLALLAVLFSARILPDFSGFTAADSTTSAPTVTANSTSSAQPSTVTVTPSEQPTQPAATTVVAAPSRSDGSTSPQCDGRGVMIIESVVDDGTGAAQSRISQLLAQHPGAQWYQPGACPSLRGSLNGQAIYPVVVDYGRDFDRLCLDYYAAGADPAYRNARILNTVAEAQNPC